MRYDYYAGVRTHYFLSSVSSHNLYTRALAHSQAFIGPLELQSLHFLSHWHIGIRTNDLKILETYYKAVTTPLGHFAKMYSTVKSQKYINQFWSKISALQSDFVREMIERESLKGRYPSNFAILFSHSRRRVTNLTYVETI